MKLKKKFVILVLDDCHEDLQTYQRFLERDRTNSYEIHPAYYAREALQFCETQNFTTNKYRCLYLKTTKQMYNVQIF